MAREMCAVGKKTAVALGFFDGVHLAHQKIIRSAVAYAKRKGSEANVLNFDRSPAEVLFGALRFYLTDNSEKSEIISALGAECLMLNTEPALLAMSGEDFIRKNVVEKLNAGAVFCGYNYTFGSDLRNSADLRKIGGELGLHVEVADEETVGGQPVSSSRIRALLQNGETEAAAALLGRFYSVTGVVEAGKRLGRTMGFPTMNIYPEPGRALIPRGVYASWAVFGGERHIGVTNIGVNPTVGDSGIRVETFLPGFSGNLYGQEVTIMFVRFMRPERRFASVEELFSQISADAEAVTALMKNRREKF